MPIQTRAVRGIKSAPALGLANLEYCM